MWGEPLVNAIELTPFCYFNSLAPCGANQWRGQTSISCPKFQLTRPVWGEPISWRVRRAPSSYFNSLAPCGANPTPAYITCSPFEFQLTRPVWGEPWWIGQHLLGRSYFNSLAPCGANRHARKLPHAAIYFNSLAPCGANLLPVALCVISNGISTHSPRVGRTLFYPLYACSATYFNSLAPCGANRATMLTVRSCSAFQLTRPVWGEPRRQRQRWRVD